MKKELTERRYTAAGVKHSKSSGALQRLREAHGLGFALGKRNISAKYRQSLLGLFWVFLPPLATSVIWIFLNGQGVVKIQDTGVPYPLFVIVGTTLWQVFVRSILAPLTAVNGNKSILTKINFPREAVLISGFYEQLLNVIAALVIVGIAMVSFGQVPGPEIIGGLIMMLLLMLGGMALGLFLLPLGMLYKDVQFALPSALQLVMYLTPVVYPQPVFKGLGRILEYNPLAPVITGARSWILNMDNMPGWEVLAITVGLVIGVILLGMLVFRITMEVLIERMGS